MMDTKKAAEAALETQHKNNDSLGIFQGLEAVSLDISADSLEPLELPIDGLHESFQTIVNSYAEGLQANRDFVLVSMVLAVSSAIGKRVRVYDGRFYNHLTTWCCIVGDSGSNKTAPVRAILDPITKRNAYNYEVYRNEMKRFKLEAKAGNEDAEIPVFHQLILGDCTPEARLKVLAENGSVLLYSDELSTFLQNLNRYTKSGETSQLLSMWSGDDVSVNRKTELPLYLESPMLNLLGSIQPDIISENFGTNFLKSSGFNFRWLFVYPDSTPPAMYSETSVPKEVEKAWSDFLCGLLDYDFSSMPILYFTDEAKRIYIDYFNELQQRLSDVPPYIAGVLKKLQITVERWAAVVHFLGNSPEVSRIQADEMEYSVRCMRYFEKCAWKVYKLVESPMNGKAIERIRKTDLLALLQVFYEKEINKTQCAESLGFKSPMFSKDAVKKKIAEYRAMGYGADSQ